MKKLVKYFSICVFLFTMAFAVLMNVNAETNHTLTVTDGASIRTTGDNQGIRFFAEVDTVEGIEERGFLIAKGEYTIDEMKDGTANVTDVKVNTHNNPKYSVVIYNIPEASYIQDLTVVAYAKYTGEETIYATQSVTRNIAEVALIANISEEIDSTDESNLVNQVVKTINENRILVVNNNNRINVVSGYKTVESYDMDELRQEFVNDVNDTCSTTLTDESTYTDYEKALALSTSNYEHYDLTSSNLYKFFIEDSTMHAKWSWILQYFAGNNTSHPSNQANVLLNFDGKIASYQVGTFLNKIKCYKLFSGQHLSQAIWSLMNSSAETGAYTENGKIKFDDAIECCKNSISNNAANLVKENEEIKLPKVTKTGYNMTGWTDDSQTYSVGSTYTIKNGVSLEASFTAIKYNVTYNNGNDSTTTTYTIEDNITLPVLEGYFIGWYENEDFTDDVVTSISEGTTGDKTYYARWYTQVYVDANGTETDVYKTITDALKDVDGYAIINVAAGTYNESFTIENDYIILVGPNAMINPNGEANRNNEAELTGTITLGSFVKNVTIKGFKFTGSSQVTVTKQADSDEYVENNDGFKFEYNYVDKTDATNAVVNFVDGNRVYNKNVEINYNYFTASSLTDTALVYLTNNINLTIKGNAFNNIKTHAVAVYDTTNGVGLAGSLDVQENNFDNVTGSAIWVNYASTIYQSKSYVLIHENKFNDVKGGACIDFESANTSYNVYEKIEITQNVFKGVYKCFWNEKIQAPVSGESKNRGGLFEYNIFYYNDSLASGYVANGSWYYFIFRNNLYCSADGNTVYKDPSSNGFPAKNLATLGTDNFESFDAYNAAIKALNE